VRKYPTKKQLGIGIAARKWVSKKACAPESTAVANANFLRAFRAERDPSLNLDSGGPAPKKTANINQVEHSSSSRTPEIDSQYLQKAERRTHATSACGCYARANSTLPSEQTLNTSYDRVGSTTTLVLILLATTLFELALPWTMFNPKNKCVLKISQRKSLVNRKSVNIQIYYKT